MKIMPWTMIDWDKLFNLKVWQYMKWVTGAVILTAIILGVYLINTGGLQWTIK